MANKNFNHRWDVHLKSKKTTGESGRETVATFDPPTKYIDIRTSHNGKSFGRDPDLDRLRVASKSAKS